jgi:hypothetical protein
MRSCPASVIRAIAPALSRATASRVPCCARSTEGTGRADPSRRSPNNPASRPRP